MTPKPVSNAHFVENVISAQVNKRIRRRLASTLTEQQLTNQILEWSAVYGWHRFHVRNSGARGISQVQGDKGFPDLVLIKRQRLIVAELKIGNAATIAGNPRPEQLQWLNLFANISVNIETYVWRPSDWSHILTTLSKD